MTTDLTTRLAQADKPSRGLLMEVGYEIFASSYDETMCEIQHPNWSRYRKMLVAEAWTSAVEMLVPFHEDKDGNPTTQMKWSLVPGAKTAFEPFGNRTTVKTDSDRTVWFWVAHVFGHRGEASHPALALALACLKARGLT